MVYELITWFFQYNLFENGKIAWDNGTKTGRNFSRLRATFKSYINNFCNQICSRFHTTFAKIFQISFQSSPSSLRSSKFILKFTSQPIRGFVYKPACEFQYELENFATKFGIFWPKFCVIEFKTQDF